MPSRLAVQTKMTLAQALHDSPAPPDILTAQTLIDLEFWDFNGEIQIGQLVAHCDLEDEIRAIFAEILVAQFPVFQMVPVAQFGWSDDVSMRENNASAFNYRLKVGKTSLSAHATGRAIDINPLQNPYICDELVLPTDAVYDASAQGTILEDGPVVRAFESRGWVWGGRWTHPRDFHHFEKPTR
jgi:hypothetical protein